MSKTILPDARKAAQKAAVLSCMMHGRDLANNRSWIAMHTGLSDRTVRDRIEDLRREGHLICNLQDGNGYFLAEGPEDVEAQYRQDCARAMSILRRIKPFRKYLLEHEDTNQFSMFDNIDFFEEEV